MAATLPRLDIDRLREEILGCDFRFRTPFGERRMVYADYTASGRGVRFIEDHLVRIQESYANTHTEDDVTGRSTTRMLHHAEDVIKRSVNGDADTRIIAVGTGATGAIKRLQEILGVYIPPATRAFLESEGRALAEATGVDAFGAFMAHVRLRRPVVFVGPYEHHSNEVSWRESLAEVVEIGLDSDGGLDLADLDRKAGDPRYEGRLKIGSLSAASNVTGMKTPVYDAARILHRHGALACFDFAACAPYVTIDMNRDAESCFDAVFFSPHKFLGGPGTSGLLLFNRRIYRDDLAPTFASGGTVDYVGPVDQDYTVDIETREKPGTPGTLQLLKAMLAIELKEAIGQDVIEGRERDHTRRMMERFLRHPGIEVLGNPDPDRRIGIVSFNLRHGKPLPSPQAGDAALERSLRHPVPRGMLVRRTLRASAPEHRPGGVASLPRRDPHRVPGDQARVGAVCRCTTAWTPRTWTTSAGRWSSWPRRGTCSCRSTASTWTPGRGATRWSAAGTPAIRDTRGPRGVGAALGGSGRRTPERKSTPDTSPRPKRRPPGCGAPLPPMEPPSPAFPRIWSISR